MRLITVDTKLVGLFGMPLRQSYSTYFQNHVYEELGLDMHYFPIEIPDRKDLLQIVEGIRRMNFIGLGITTPYKHDIMDYLDDMSDVTRKMGACNTVVIENGRMTGYNTDGIGAITSLQLQGGVEVEGKTFFVLGAGGTGKAVGLELAVRKAKKIYFVSRGQSCEDLAELLNGMYPGTCEAIRVADTARFQTAVAESEVILNLTGVGAYGQLDQTPIDASLILPEQVCFEAIYNPEKTRFLQEAEAKGCKIINGLGMLAYQGARQIKRWAPGVEEPAELCLHYLKQAVHQA